MVGDMALRSGFGSRAIPAEGRDLVVVGGGVDDRAELVNDESHILIKEQVRALLLARIDPAVAARMPRPQLLSEIRRLVNDIADQTRVRLNEREEGILADELVDDMVGLGPLEPLLADETINDILVNGPNDIYVERYGKLDKTSVRFRDAAHLVNVAQRIATAIGRRIDESTPMVDARLSDGSRVNIVLPPLVLNGGTISIRKFSKREITLEMMAAQGNLSQAMARFLEIAAQVRLNILISGGTGSGKTTLMNAVSRSINQRERIITIEDAVELRLQQPHVVQMETRVANVEGVGRIAQRDLVRNALRMRPDRIIVGEVRGEEAFDMMQAMNTGHDGSMSTIHSNTPRDALFRLENMVLMGSVHLPLRAIRAQISGAINLLVHVDRMRDGVRRVTHIVEIVGMEGDVITMQDVFNFKQTGENRDGSLAGKFEMAGFRPHCVDRAAAFGLERQLLESVAAVVQA
jgi:pilus assembly protein CpaF